MLLDQKQRPWILAVSGFALLAAVVYFVDARGWFTGGRGSLVWSSSAGSPSAPSGSTVVGLTLGIIAYAIMLFCAGLGMKRRVPHWRLGKAQTWLRGHIWLGLLIVPLVALHAAWHVGPAFSLANLLWILMLAVAISGIVGVFIQQSIPRILIGSLDRPRAFSENPEWQPTMNAESPAQALPQLLSDCAARAERSVLLYAGRYKAKAVKHPIRPNPRFLAIDDEKKPENADHLSLFDLTEPCAPAPTPPVPPPAAAAPAGAAAAKPAVPAAPGPAAAAAAAPVVAKAATPAPPAAPTGSAPTAPAPTAPAQAAQAPTAPAVAASPANPTPATAAPAAAAAPKPAAAPTASGTSGTPTAPGAPAAPAGPKAGDTVQPAPEPGLPGAEPIREFWLTKGRAFFMGDDAKSPLAYEPAAATIFALLRRQTPKEVHPAVDDLEELSARRRNLLLQRRWMRALHGWLIIHVPLSWGFIVLVAIHAVGALRYFGVPGH